MGVWFDDLRGFGRGESTLTTSIPSGALPDEEFAEFAEAPLERSGLRTQVLWTMLGNGVFLASQYGLLMAVAKLGNATMVGQFSLALAIATPPMVLSQMQLRQILVTDVDRAVPFGDYFWTRLAAGLLVVAAIALGGLALKQDHVLLVLTVALAVARLGESMSDIIQGALQRDERTGMLAGSLMTRGFTGLLALAAVLYWTGSLVAATIAFAGAWFACALVIDLPLVLRAGERLPLSWHPSILVRLIKHSAPLTLAAGLLSLSVAVPRYFLNHAAGKQSVALFAVAMLPISLMGLFTGAVSQTTLARASGYLHTGQLNAFRALGRRLTLVSFLTGMGVIVLLLLAGRWLLRTLYTSEFEGAVPIMLVLATGVAIGSFGAFGSAVITAGRRYGLTLATMGLALGVELLACWILVPRYGVMGAAWAELAKYVATAAFLNIVGRSIFPAYRAAKAAFSA